MSARLDIIMSNLLSQYSIWISICTIYHNMEGDERSFIYSSRKQVACSFLCTLAVNLKKASWLVGRSI
jgi:hypothetical protein